MALTARPEALAIDLDLVGGLAGDMFVAAMVDALPELEAPVLAEVAAVRPAGAAFPEFRAITNGGLRARRFGPATSPAVATRKRVRAGVPTTMAHGHHDGTSYPALRRWLERASLPPPTREHALALLRLLGEAEAQVHGIALDAVHFHELADWDSLLDLVAAGCIAGRLQGATWSASVLPLGGGPIRTEHGLLPVPAPATSQLLQGYPWRDDGIAGERVTPTGAAILRHLVCADACGGRRPSGRLVGIGCGAGTRTLPGVPNIARALVFERMPYGSAAAIGTENIALVEFDVDDMTGEEIAHAADRLRAETGVVDVSVGTRTGKKGRPLADFRLMVRPDAVDAVARACFAETATLGLRVREESRRMLARSETALAVGDARVRVKVAQRPSGERTAKAAHDDVAHARGLASRRQARVESERGALEERTLQERAAERGATEPRASKRRTSKRSSK